MKIYIFFLIFLSTISLDSKEIFSNYPQPLLRDASYRSATERYLEFFGREVIDGSLKARGVSLVNKNLFDRIAFHEEVGFIGYHGSTQDFRIFQDIIRMVIEEIVKIPIRNDFHFFRIPGEPYFSAYHDIHAVPENLRGQPSRFLWLNFAIYGNHNNLGRSSYYYFTMNRSAYTQNFGSRLVPLFDRLKIDSSKIQELIQIGCKYMQEENGVIYQLFDASHYNPWRPLYQLADSHCLAYGYATTRFLPDVLGMSASPFNMEIRMLLNNATTLNPFSDLKVHRYDKLTPETTEKYVEELRAFVKTLSFSEVKRDEYKHELLTLWGENES